MRSELDELDKFEARLKNQRQRELPVETRAAPSSENDSLPPLEHIRQLAKSIDQQAIVGGSQTYLQSLKAKGAETAAARKERERRRLKLLVEQAATQQQAASQHVSEMFLERVLGTSRDERKLAEHIQEVRAEKDRIKANRIAREEQYAQRRQQDFQNVRPDLPLLPGLALSRRAMRRDAEKFAQLMQDREEMVVEEMSRLGTLREQQSQAKAQRHEAKCREAAEGIVDLACKIAEYREVMGTRLVPAAQARFSVVSSVALSIWSRLPLLRRSSFSVREWESLFVAGCPLYESSPQGAAALGSGSDRSIGPGSPEEPAAPAGTGHATASLALGLCSLPNLNPPPSFTLAICLRRLPQPVGTDTVTVGALLDGPDSAQTTGLLAASSGRATSLLYQSPDAEELLDAERADEYAHLEGPWAPREGDAPESRELQSALEHLANIVEPPPPPPPKPYVPPFPIKAAILGRPKAGRTSVAEGLAKQFSLTVIQPAELLKEALGAAAGAQATAAEPSAAAGSPPAPDASSLPPLVRLGRQAKECLDKGDEVPDELMAALVAHRMRRFDQQRYMVTHPPSAPAQGGPATPGTGGLAAKTEAPEGAAPPAESQLRAYLEQYLGAIEMGDLAAFPADQAGPTAAAHPSAVPAHPMHGGVVLDGFPATLAQAAALEKELTGFEQAPPAKGAKRGKPVPPPKKVATPAAGRRGASPTPEPGEGAEADDQAPLCALDLVVRLDVSDQTCVRRVLQLAPAEQQRIQAAQASQLAAQFPDMVPLGGLAAPPGPATAKDAKALAPPGSAAGKKQPTGGSAKGKAAPPPDPAAIEAAAQLEAAKVVDPLLAVKMERYERDEEAIAQWYGQFRGHVLEVCRPLASAPAPPRPVETPLDGQAMTLAESIECAGDLAKGLLARKLEAQRAAEQARLDGPLAWPTLVSLFLPVPVSGGCPHCLPPFLCPFLVWLPSLCFGLSYSFLCPLLSSLVGGTFYVLAPPRDCGLHPHNCSSLQPRSSHEIGPTLSSRQRNAVCAAIRRATELAEQQRREAEERARQEEARKEQEERERVEREQREAEERAAAAAKGKKGKPAGTLPPGEAFGLPEGLGLGSEGQKEGEPTDRPAQDAASSSALQLPPDSAALLLREWRDAAGQHERRTKTAFRVLRRLDHAVHARLSALRAQFAAFFGRQDGRVVPLVGRFQAAFNEMDPLMRERSDTKAELHLRTAELRDDLWDLADQKKDQSEQVFQAVMSDGWAEQAAQTAADQYVALMQIEVDRYQCAARLLGDYAALRHGLPLETADRPPFEVGTSFAQVPGAPGALSPLPPKGGPGPKSKAPAKALAAAGRKSQTPAPQEAPKADGMRYTENPDGAAILARVAAQAQSDEKPNLSCPALAVAYASALSLVTASRAAAAQLEQQLAAYQEALRQHQADPDGTPAPVAPAFDRQREEALATEDARLQDRLGRLQDMGGRHLSQLRAHMAALQAVLDGWLCAAYQADMKAVSALVAHVGQAIERNQPLPHPLRLSGSELVVDESVLVEPPLELAAAQAPEQPADEWALTTSQLEAIRSHLAALAPSGYMSAADFADLMARLASGGTMGVAPLPPVWAQLTREQFYGAAVRLDAHLGLTLTPYIDWRMFLVQASLPRTARPEELETLAGALRRASDGDDMLTRDALLATRFYFETAPAPSRDAPLPDLRFAASPFPLEARLKEFYFELFKVPSLAPAAPAAPAPTQPPAVEEPPAVEAEPVARSPSAKGLPAKGATPGTAGSRPTRGGTPLPATKSPEVVSPAPAPAAALSMPPLQCRYRAPAGAILRALAIDEKAREGFRKAFRARAYPVLCPADRGDEHADSIPANKLLELVCPLASMIPAPAQDYAPPLPECVMLAYRRTVELLVETNRLSAAEVSALLEPMAASPVGGTAAARGVGAPLARYPVAWDALLRSPKGRALLDACTDFKRRPLAAMLQSVPRDAAPSLQVAQEPAAPRPETGTERASPRL
ncbi:putative sperm flagellar protein 2 [Paratrimastix pyriformis]|uniref:Sperm flagellar protein 2 n=1 Tax=Paratrimastix pyriformis TaxID=342808 RepID=A0ABQ8UKY8_9EUKA|nr:putative sperm flagellar protein 2 [Paratrimastix pyriformis]